MESNLLNCVKILLFLFCMFFIGVQLINNIVLVLGDLGSIPGLGRSPGGGNGNPLLVFLPGESHGQRSLTVYSPWIARVGHDLVTKPPLNQFQVYSKVIQLYMYLFFFKFFPHLGYCKELSQVPCAMQQVFVCQLFFFQILKLISIYFSLKQLYFPHFSIQVFDFSFLIYVYGFCLFFCFFNWG